MTPTEFIIQVLKIAIGLAFGAYFVWWSLQVLDRLAPEDEAPTPTVGHIIWVTAGPTGTTRCLFNRAYAKTGGNGLAFAPFHSAEPRFG